jgi:pimeloyl-ACP methyl ester carboxylesterase
MPFLPKVRRQVDDNLLEWQALSTSTDGFPNVRREDVAALRVPTLLMEGEKTLALHRIVDAQLAALLPDQRRVTITSASHEMWDEQPVKCREAAMQFLAR